MKFVGKVLYGKFKDQSVCINDSSTAIYITPSIYYDENKVSCIIGKKMAGKANIVAWEKYEEIQEKSNMGKIVGATALFGVVGAIISANAGKEVKYNIVVEYEDGDKGLLQLEPKGYEIFLSVCFGLKKEITLKTEETGNSIHTNNRNIYINEDKLDVSLKRAQLFLEENDWKTASDYYNAILDVAPEYEAAYIGLLCCELHIVSEAELIYQQTSFNENINYRRALRFAEPQRKAQLMEYENIREKEAIYNSARELFNEGCYLEAIDNFKKITEYKDSKEYIGLSVDKYDKKRERSYNEGLHLMKKGDYDLAIQKFKEAPDWKDEYNKIKECRNKIVWIEKEKRKRDAQKKEEERIKDRKKTITLILVAIVISILIIVVSLVVSSNDYTGIVFTNFIYGGDESGYMELCV